MTDAGRFILRLSGLLFCTVPVALTVVFYFPLWIERGSETFISGFALVLILISMVPLFKVFQKILRSPSAHTIWFILFVTFFVLSKIADEMTVISFVGYIGNIIGALFFRAARRGERGENERQL